MSKKFAQILSSFSQELLGLKVFCLLIEVDLKKGLCTENARFVFAIQVDLKKKLNQ